ncbi:MAG: winged helix-turn-helix transcriptional regulator [Candidatus Sericytochromatia bacterium]|jgi:DNA-binding transcriptional ArsR family regulator|nr:winged helix-turn-helix transcriptional regulator [Candidatus Sericytochromatia bacterium]
MSLTQMRIFKAEFFKALSSPVRIAILDLLREGEKSVNELTASFEIEQAGISQHLAILRAKNLVKNRKVGNNVYYSIADSSIFTLLDDAARIYQNNLIDIQQLKESVLG